MASTVRTLREARRNAITHFTNPIGRRGLLVAFEGPDGSGKTTQRKLFKKWLRSREAPDPLLNSYADHLAYIQFELGKKKARMLLSGLEAYWRFINLGQRFDNSRLLADTALGLPEPAPSPHCPHI